MLRSWNLYLKFCEGISLVACVSFESRSVLCWVFFVNGAINRSGGWICVTNTHICVDICDIMLSWALHRVHNHPSWVPNTLTVKLSLEPQPGLWMDKKKWVSAEQPHSTSPKHKLVLTRMAHLLPYTFHQRSLMFNSLVCVSLFTDFINWFSL